MELQFNLTEEDYIKFNMYHMDNSSTAKKNYYLYKYIFPVFFIPIMPFIGYKILNQPFLYWIVIGTIVSILWAATSRKRYDKLTIKNVKKFIREGDNSSMFGETTLTLNENNITLTGEDRSESYSRKSIKDIKVYDDLILVYVSAINAVIVPTKGLEEDEKESFISELKN